MTSAALKFMSDIFEELNIPYQFAEWTTNPVPNPYFVGEYIETESITKEENGYQETTFILTGTGESWIALENAKAIIESNIYRTSILPNGNGIGVFYSNSQIVPTGDDVLKRIQINLNVKEWSVI